MPTVARQEAPFTKWMLGLTGTVLVAWMGYISVTMITISSNIGIIANEVKHLQKQMQTKGGLFTMDEADRLSNMLKEVNNRTISNRERLIKLELRCGDHIQRDEKLWDKRN